MRPEPSPKKMVVNPTKHPKQWKKVSKAKVKSVNEIQQEELEKRKAV